MLLHVKRYSYLESLWSERFAHLDRQSILIYVDDVISRHRVMEAARMYVAEIRLGRAY